MNKTKVNLLIIGAGANGACLAYEAIKRGLTVALIDSGDISGGTSCRSTKLLHGGVRYLELAFKSIDFAQFKLVREALRERGYWLQKAPFLSRRMELAIPTASCFEQLYYRTGLGLYDILSGKSTIGSSRLLSKSEINKALPFLKQAGLHGGVAYFDGAFNDARLNLLLALTAEREGALINTYSKIIALKHNKEGKISGAISKNSYGQHLWEADAIVNATGVHADKIRQLAHPKIQDRLVISRGVHIVLKENLCPNNIGLLLPSTDDGRILFILPFYGHTLVGTTDTSSEIASSNIPSKSEKKYLIDHLRKYYPSITENSITSCWAGGRPLIKSSDNNGDISSSKLVREHEIELLSNGLISMLGGKWTTCRSVALDTLKAIEKVLNRKLPDPKEIPLIGTHENIEQTNILLEEQRQELKSLLPRSNLRDKQLLHLQSSYGLEAINLISDRAIQELQPISNIVPLCEAEIKYAIDKEHVISVTDLLSRRSRLAMINLNEAKRILPIVKQHFINAGLEITDINLEN